MNPDGACMYRTSASPLGRSYTLYAEGVVCIFGECRISNSSIGFRVNHHSLVSYFSLQPVRIGLPSDENTTASFLVNNAVQFALHMGLTTTIVLVKEGMMYPAVGKSDDNCGIGSVAVADETF